MRHSRIIVAFVCVLSVYAAVARDKPERAPIKVYILSGQSNMVGMGDVSGGTTRWGAEFGTPTVSIYEGSYDASKDYDNITPLKTQKLAKFGGVSPTLIRAEGCR